VRRVVVLQPGYLPWLGFFDQLARADVFVLLDDVQYTKNDWRNRNRIKSSTGEPQWLTVPVLHRGRSTQLIKDAEITSDSRWAHSHLQAIRSNYARAPFFDLLFPVLKEVLSRPWRWLCELDRALIESLARLLGIDTPLLNASELPRFPGSSTERLVAIVRHLGGDRYLTGDAARSYLDLELFREAGITLEWQSYHHPRYPQLHGDFVPYLSVADLIFNLGPESLAMLRDGASALDPESGG
jgi:hypothetical protein